MDVGTPADAIDEETVLLRSRLMAFTWLAAMVALIGVIVWKIQHNTGDGADVADVAGLGMPGGGKPEATSLGIDPTPYKSLITSIEQDVFEPPAPPPGSGAPGQLPGATFHVSDLYGACNDLAIQLSQRQSWAGKVAARRFLELAPTLGGLSHSERAERWETVRDGVFEHADWFGSPSTGPATTGTGTGADLPPAPPPRRTR